MTVSKRIQKLRKERNLSQAGLAEKAGLKPPAISQYESGARSPSFESLVKLSSALGVSSDYLLVGEPSKAYFDIEDSLIRERLLNTESTADSVSRLIAHLTRRLPYEKREMLLEYAIMLLGSGKVMLTLPYFSDFRAYADYIFQNTGEGILPVDLALILQKLNVTLADTTLRDCEGLLVKGKENMILLDQGYENSQRQRFTIATLLGHLVIPWHSDTIYKAREFSSFKTEDPIEMEALQFAAYLLMPREELARDLSAATVSLDALRRLAGEKYDVSVFALANSLVEMYPGKFAVVQSDGEKIMKTFQGTRPVKQDLDPHSLAAGFMKSLPKKREMRTAKLEEDIWFQDGQAGAYVLEESIYDPQIGRVLTLLTIP